MICAMTTKATRRSSMGGGQTVPVGTISDCGRKAIATCPSCATPVCANHARHLSTMNGDLARGRYRRCSACGHEWLPW